jgi:hypothetical protein
LSTLEHWPAAVMSLADTPCDHGYSELAVYCPTCVGTKAAEIERVALLEDRERAVELERLELDEEREQLDNRAYTLGRWEEYLEHLQQELDERKKTRRFPTPWKKEEA